MGFFDETHKHIVIQPGQEAEVAMSDAYFAKLEAVLANCASPKPYELSGGAGGRPKPEAKQPEAKQPEVKEPEAKQPEAKKETSQRGR